MKVWTHGHSQRKPKLISRIMYRISARLGRPRWYAALEVTPQILLYELEKNAPKSQGPDLYERS